MPSLPPRAGVPRMTDTDLSPAFADASTDASAKDAGDASAGVAAATVGASVPAVAAEPLITRTPCGRAVTGAGSGPGFRPTEPEAVAAARGIGVTGGAAGELATAAVVGSAVADSGDSSAADGACVATEEASAGRSAGSGSGCDVGGVAVSIRWRECARSARSYRRARDRASAGRGGVMLRRSGPAPAVWPRTAPPRSLGRRRPSARRAVAAAVAGWRGR